MKKIIIGDVKLPDQKWIVDHIKGDFLWFYTENAMIGDPYGCTIRNIISNLIHQEISEVYVVGLNGSPINITNNMLEDYFQKEQIDIDAKNTIEYMFDQTKGFSFSNWIKGMHSKEHNVRETVKLIKQHPIIPKRLKVSGYLAEENKKRLKQIVD